MSKFVSTSAIVDPNKRLPFAAKTLNWLQTAFKELFAAIAQALTNYSANQIVVLSGATVTYTGPTGGTASVLAGWVYYNGELYAVKGNNSLTIGTGQIPVWTIVTLPDTTAAGGTGNDPTTFSDGSSQNAHMTDFFILASGPAGGSGVTGYVCDYNSANVITYIPQSDWSQATTTSPNYIKNKPTISRTDGTASLPPSTGSNNFNIDYSLNIIGNIKELVLSVESNWVSTGSGVLSLTLDLTSVLSGNTIKSFATQTSSLNVLEPGAGILLGGYISCASATSLQINFSEPPTAGQNIVINGQITLRLT